MGAFSTSMRATATKLVTDLGNPCILTKITKGSYIPSLGETPVSKKNYSTYSAPVKKISQDFGQMGINTNLGGFDDNKVIVPWIGMEIDETWRYNDMNIIKVQPTETQGDIVIYTITIGEVEG
tara:strand:- start:13614 stop:13982 length:369 start_codon:yes stop_codon:yes gene_type:complete